MNESIGSKKTVVIGCAKCKASTTHEILASETERGSFDDFFFYETHYEIVHCMGCQNTCFRKAASNSEDTDEEGQAREQVDVYPAPMERQASVDKRSLPIQVGTLYERR
jgi:hypothetical protein